MSWRPMVLYSLRSPERGSRTVNGHGSHAPHSCKLSPVLKPGSGAPERGNGDAPGRRSSHKGLGFPWEQRGPRVTPTICLQEGPSGLKQTRVTAAHPCIHVLQARHLQRVAWGGWRWRKDPKGCCPDGDVSGTPGWGGGGWGAWVRWSKPFEKGSALKRLASSGASLN